MSDFQTPPWVCEYMVDLLPDGITEVLEPTPGNGNLVKALVEAGYSTVTLADCWDLDIWELNDGGIEFDAVVMNPPFSPMSKGYDILFACMELMGVVVALMPWLTLINSQRRTTYIAEYGLAGVHHLPRSAFPGSRVQTCILEMRRGFEGKTVLNFVGETI
jgi:hypothetical protein